MGRTSTVSPLLLALVATLAALCACGGADARRASHMARGQKYFAEDQLEKARIEFADALQIAPNDAQARFMGGRVAERLGNVRAAAGMYQGAIDVNPDHLQARARLGRLLVLSGAPARALELIGPALAHHPDEPDLLAVRAAARAQLKDTGTALIDAARAVQLDPLNEGAVSLLAGLYWQTGQTQRAVELLTATLVRLPNSVDLHQALARLYMLQGESKLAEAELLRTVQSRPRDLELHYQLASFYIQAKRLDDAERTLRAAMATRPESDAAKLAYADFLTACRSPAQGEQALRELIAHDPNNYPLRLGLGALQQRAGETQDAIVTFRSIVAQDPEGAGGIAARDRIAAIEASSGHPDEALAQVDEALKRNPRDADALTLRGNLRLAKGDAPGAVADLRAVLRDQPTEVPVLRALARAHLANQEPALAEENLRTALTVAAGDVAVRVDLAEILWRTKRAEEAVKLLEETVRLNPDDTGIPARAALVQANLVKPDLSAARIAAEDLQRARPGLALGPYLAGLVAEQQQRRDDAQRDFEHALELQPEYSEALTALARLDLERGQRAQALALARDAVNRSPRSAVMQNLLGEVYLAQQRYSDAAGACAEAVRLAPSWWVPYRNIAQAKLGAQDPAGAVGAYQAGVRATAEPALVVELAALDERQGSIDDAIHEYELLYQRRPHLELVANNLAMLLVTYRKDRLSLDRARDLTAPFANSEVAALLDTHGWVMFKRGETLQALTALEKASAEAPDSKVIRYHLGMAELQLGRREQARADLESALSGAVSFAGSEEARHTLASLQSRTSG
jgi:tetratricopeptide (TPR) repeat protein